MKIAVLIATHDRRNTTLSALHSLREALTHLHGVDLHLFVADANSSDGTADGISAVFEDATILRLSSDHFWAESMREAYIKASTLRPDYYLWLNDDVILDADSLTKLMSASQDMISSVIVGSTRDPITEELTYAGRRLGPWWKRLSTKPVILKSPLTKVDLMNGNVVLVPHAVDLAVGGFSRGYRHSLADFDYSLRARSAGVQTLVVSPTIGTCSRNSPWNAGYAGLTARQRLRRAASPKGAPVRQWVRYCLRHGGVAGPLYCFMPYLGAALQFSSRLDRD